jgi:hypothetical protein
VKGKKMENQIVCPHCKKPVTDSAMIADVIKGEGTTTRSIICECGERITFWQMTAQLRDHKTIGYRVQNWFRSLLQSKG